MSDEERLKEVIKTMIKTLNQMGVTLMNISVEGEIPVYFIEIDNNRLIQSVEDTLSSAFGILWVLSYGKVNDENRDKKIDLRYNIVNA